MMRGPGRHWPRGQCIGHGHPGKGPGAPACHVSVEGESPGRALPVFRELVGSEAVVVPGGAIVGESAEGSSCQGSHASQP